MDNKKETFYYFHMMIVDCFGGRLQLHGKPEVIEIFFRGTEPNNFKRKEINLYPQELEEGKGSGCINPLVKMVPDTVCGVLSLYSKFVRPSSSLTNGALKSDTLWIFSPTIPPPSSGLKTS